MPRSLPIVMLHETDMAENGCCAGSLVTVRASQDPGIWSGARYLSLSNVVRPKASLSNVARPTRAYLTS